MEMQRDLVNYGPPTFVPFDAVEAELKKEPSEERGQKFKNTYTEPPAELFSVRGPNYLSSEEKNNKDLKQPSLEAPYTCVALNILKTPKPYLHSALEVSLTKKMLMSNPEDDEGNPFPKFLIICWLFTSFWGRESTCVQQVFQRKPNIGKDDPALLSVFKRFMEGSDEEKRNTFKYVFKMVDAPPVVITSVQGLGGERPVIIGTKLTTNFYKGANYLEVDMDVSSSTVASMLNGIILKSLGGAVVDCAWLMEGQKKEELPERIVAGVRINFVYPEEVTVVLDENGQKV